MQASQLVLTVLAACVLGVASMHAASSHPLAFGTAPAMTWNRDFRSTPNHRSGINQAHFSRGRPMLRMTPDDFDGPQPNSKPAQPPQMMQFSDAAQPTEQQRANFQSSAPEQQTQPQEIAAPASPPAVSKTGQMIGLARRGWWLSALTVALDGIAAIVAVVSSTLALLSVLFMDLALPSATSLGLMFLTTLSCIAASIFVAASAASAVIGMLAMSDSIKTYFQMHKRIDIMKEGNDEDNSST